MRNYLVILVILVLLLELYRLLRGYWLRRLLEKKKKGKGLHKAPVLRLKSERDCHIVARTRGNGHVLAEKCRWLGRSEKGGEGERSGF